MCGSKRVGWDFSVIYRIISLQAYLWPCNCVHSSMIYQTLNLLWVGWSLCLDRQFCSQKDDKCLWILLFIYKTLFCYALLKLELTIKWLTTAQLDRRPPNTTVIKPAWSAGCPPSLQAVDIGDTVKSRRCTFLDAISTANVTTKFLEQLHVAKQSWGGSPPTGQLASSEGSVTSVISD